MKQNPEAIICRNYDLIEESVKVFGVSSQIDKAIEELIELTTELISWKKEMAKKNTSHRQILNIIENIKLERTDVGIMLKDLDIIFDYTDEESLLNCMKQFQKLENYIANRNK